jgi:tRNA-uridine 2-sulfurtransferase
LAVGAARLSEINRIGGGAAGTTTVKVRSMAKPVSARFDGEWLSFAAPEYGVSPGQAAVLYAGDRVIGGGWIEETIAAEITEAA